MYKPNYSPAVSLVCVLPRWQFSGQSPGVRNLVQLSHLSSFVLSSEKDMPAQEVIDQFIHILKMCKMCVKDSCD